jgi:hypothetical protein
MLLTLMQGKSNWTSHELEDDLGELSGAHAHTSTCWEYLNKEDRKMK